MYELTNGKVTPLIGQVMERAGYDKNYSLIPKSLTKPKALNKTLVYNGNTLQVKYPCILDYGAAGKGYLVDLIAELFNSYGISNYLIDAGGDIYHFPASPSLLTPVGLENPDNPMQAIGIVNLAKQAICGSSGNRRKWANFHHIIDPISLKSVDQIKATWAIADNCMLADGMATCLFFTEPEILQKKYDFEYLIIKWDNSIRVSKDFPGQLFYEEN
jgi:thiamine biosynthesis lipoprotein